jgi:hypothetical protein
MRKSCAYCMGLMLILLSANHLRSQSEENKHELIQQRIEYLSENLEIEDIALEQITEDLYYYIDHKINLNKTDGEDLKALLLLTDIQIVSLLNYRKQFGKLISIYEIQAIPYWDLNTIFLILPFIHVDDKFDQLQLSFKEFLKYGTFEMFLRYQRILEQKNGFQNVPDEVLQNTNSIYHGNPDRYYSRLRFTYRNNISMGITMEKDPGEAFFRRNNPYGFDFYSAHAFYQGGKYLRTVALGDYQIQIGQGLNLWVGHAFNKTSDVINIKKNARGIRPYASIDEVRFMRGTAVELVYKKIHFTTFGSVKRVSATLQQTLDSLSQEEQFASAINLTGLHRTTSEIARKNALQERIFGSYVQYKTAALQIGLSAVHHSYDKVFDRAWQPHNQFDFRGRTLMNVGLDYNYVHKNTNLFGEVVRSGSGAIGMLHGALIALDSKMSLSMLYRNYPRNFHTFYAQGFREGSRTQNEEGLYTGLFWKIHKRVTWDNYLDIFRFPWLRFQVNAPSQGYEFLSQMTYKPDKKLELYARFRQQVRPRNSREITNGIRIVEDVIQRNYRLHFSYKASESITLKSRVEFVSVHRKSQELDQGLLIYQDIIFKPKSSPISLSLRYALFDTDSYDTRIYAFESNMLNVFYIPAHSGKGMRAYALLRYQFAKRFDLWLRYAVFIYENVTSIGTGPERINGNRRSDIGVQLRMRI